MSTLYLFDVDGTITEPFNNNLLPGRLEFFQVFDWDNNACALVSNQGGVGLRWWMEKNNFGKPEEYPTYRDVRDRMLELAAILSLDPDRSAIFLAFAYQSKRGTWSPEPDRIEYDPSPCGLPPHFVSWSPDWRKPNGGMVQMAIDHGAGSPREFDQVVMIGDRPEDEAAAMACGIKFVRADKFKWGGK